MIFLHFFPRCGKLFRSKNIYEKGKFLMKKLICYVLILAMGVMLFAGCGNFDIENEDLSAYVKL